MSSLCIAATRATLEFARCPPAAVRHRDGGVMPDRGDRRHVQRAADIGPAPANAAIADARAAVVGQRGNPDEFADLPLAQRPEFRQPREQTGGGRRADARHGLQQAIADPPQRTGLDACSRSQSVWPTCLEPGDVRQQILADGAARERQAIALSRQHLDELAPPRDQRLQVRLQVIGDGRGTGSIRMANWQSTPASRASVFPVAPRPSQRPGHAAD